MDLGMNVTAIYMLAPATGTARKMVQVTLEAEGGACLDDATRSAWAAVAPEVQMIISILVSSHHEPGPNKVFLQGEGYDLKLERKTWKYGTSWRFMWGDEEVPSGEKWVFTWCPKTKLKGTTIEEVHNCTTNVVV
ncbi:hypothetical protein CALVIDRAFT_564778 [Calocera viscosa TUFC12733]|uniref:Uncharacterized protein n=1 Tax=Calocera viscosa (strain TUFC12733) TaxID=1330018 RepID=A0A167L635_CALVF|nr:hypothetical protein CALVIDRAFT_564778 [Calocera viscosa TUFC12733]